MTSESVEFDNASGDSQTGNVVMADKDAQSIYVGLGGFTIYLDVSIPADGVIVDAWRTDTGLVQPGERVKISHDGATDRIDKKLGWGLRETLQRAEALLDGYRHYLDTADDIDDAIELGGVMADIARALADPRPW